MRNFRTTTSRAAPAPVGDVLRSCVRVYVCVCVAFVSANMRARAELLDIAHIVRYNSVRLEIDVRVRVCVCVCVAEGPHRKPHMQRP